MSVEKNLEARLRKFVHRMGGYCVKLLPWAETGLPDRMLILPGGYIIFVELKSLKALASLRKKGKLTKQGIWRNRLLQCGHEHWVVYDEKTYLCLEKRIAELILF